MKKARRFLVGLLAMAMSVGAPMSVSAADITGASSGNLTGTGAVEGSVNTDVIKVVLPTTSLNFTIDPQGLLVKVDGNKTSKELGYQVTFKNGTNEATKTDTGLVFFKKTTLKEDGKTVESVEYTNSLDLEVVNKSACNVTIIPSISAKVPADVDLVTSGSVSNTAEKPQLSLELSYGSSNTLVAKSEGVDGSPVSLAGIPDAYKYGYNKGYTYTLNEETIKDGTVTPPTTSFKLAAKCNTNSGWGTVAKSKTKPSVTVTWTVAKSDSASTT